MTENGIVRPSYDPGGKTTIPNPNCTSARHAQSYLDYQLSTPENIDVINLTNFTEK